MNPTKDMPPKPAVVVPPPLEPTDRSKTGLIAAATAPAPEEQKAAGGIITEQNNPATPAVTAFGITQETRISMNAPDRRLEVPPIPGWHLHWFADTNIPKAIQAGYEFVDPAEVPARDRSIGGRPPGTKSEDLGGARISQIGGTDAAGRLVHAVLMKVREDWYFDDQRKIAERNLLILNQIFRKKAPIRAEGESQADYAQRYVREAVIDMSNGRFRKTT